MNRVIVLRLPNGDEEVLAHFFLKSAATGKYIAADFRGKAHLEIFHFSFRRNELVLQSSTDVHRRLTFFPMWNIKQSGYSCRVVHGDDLLDVIHHESIDSGLI